MGRDLGIPRGGQRSERPVFHLPVWGIPSEKKFWRVIKLPRILYESLKTDERIRGFFSSGRVPVNVAQCPWKKGREEGKSGVGSLTRIESFRRKATFRGEIPEGLLMINGLLRDGGGGVKGIVGIRRVFYRREFLLGGKRPSSWKGRVQCFYRVC